MARITQERLDTLNPGGGAQLGERSSLTQACTDERRAGSSADERHFVGIVHQGGTDLTNEVLGPAPTCAGTEQVARHPLVSTLPLFPSWKFALFPTPR
jgi:hypothetical protein